MSGNKYLICQLLNYGSNVNCISRQCVRNVSVACGVFQKLKLKEKNEITENVSNGDSDIGNVNERCCDTGSISRTYKNNTYSEKEPKNTEEIPTSINYEIHKHVNEEKLLVPDSTDVHRLMSNSILNPEERFDSSRNNEAPWQSSYIQLPMDTIEKITSFPILGSKDSNTESKGNNKKSGIPSVTVILRDTMSNQARLALETWKKNMIVKLGKEEFDVYVKDLMKNGRLLHSCIQNSLAQKEIEISPQIKLAYNSVKPVLSDIEVVESLETYVTHPNLMYRGIVDCVATYRGELCVIDWKKSDKQKSTLESTYDAPVQVAAYIGAINASGGSPLTLTKGMVVVAYTNGEPATIHEIKGDLLEKSWKSWLKRLKQFYHKETKK